MSIHRGQGKSSFLKICDFNMSKTMTAVSVLIMMCFLIGGCKCQRDVYVSEGKDVTFKCSVDPSDNPMFISWIMPKVNHVKRKIITSCSLISKCIQKGKITLNKKSKTANYTELTYIMNNTYISQLTILNVTTDMRMLVIACVMLDSNDISNLNTVESYNMIVYKLPQTADCQAAANNENIVDIACKFSMLYPEIMCYIFPDFKDKIVFTQNFYSNNISELANVQHVRYTEKCALYYNASCSLKYYPKEARSYQFHIEVYFNGFSENLLTLTTNQVTVSSIPHDYLAAETNELHKNNHDETNNAFYVLLAAVSVFGIICVVLIWWVVRRWHRKCSSRDTTHDDLSIFYEPIHYGRVNKSDDIQNDLDDGPGDTDKKNIILGTKDFISPQGYDQQTEYINTSVPKRHTKNNTSSEYIDPCTPSPTISRSSEKNNSTDMSWDEKDNYSTSHDTSMDNKENYSINDDTYMDNAENY